MRWFYLVIVIIFVAATLIFVLQNFDLVTMALREGEHWRGAAWAGIKDRG